MEETVYVQYTGSWAAPVRFSINGHEYFFCADDEHRIQEIPIGDAERLVEMEHFGYAKVELQEREAATKDETPRPSIGEIYDMCDDAGVKPGDLRIEGEHPTLPAVEAAIEAAKEAAE